MRLRVVGLGLVVLLGAVFVWAQTIHRETVVWDFVNGLKSRGVWVEPGGGTGGPPIECPDVGGNHLNFSTNTWECGTSSSGGVPGNAKADGTTKGIATFNPSQFSDDGSGLISSTSPGGGSSSPVTFITTTYTVPAGDFLQNATLAVSDGAFTITLTAVASQPPAGMFITIVNYSGGPITIAPDGQTINGETEVLVLPGSIPQAPSSARIVSTGTDYVASLAGQDLPLSKLPIIESQTVLGRTTAGTGSTEVLTTSQVKTMLAIDQVDNTSDATKLSAVGVLTNKLVLDRVVTPTVTSNAITPDLDVGDVFTLDAISANLTINAPVGTNGKPFNEEWIVFRFKSSTPRTLTWNAIFTNEHGIPLPTATTGDGTIVDRIKFVYNSTTTKWGLVASTIAVIRDVTSLASATTYTCNVDFAAACEMQMTGATGTLTVAAPTGTPSNGQALTLRFMCTNSQVFAWNAIFLANAIQALPAACPADTTRWLSVDVEYSTVLTKWEMVRALRRSPAVTTLASSATYTCPGNTASQCQMSTTEGAGTLTVAAPTGTPEDGQLLMLLFLCTNLQSFSWNAIFISSPNVTLPTSCLADTAKYTVVGVRYSAALAKWQALAVN